MTKVIENIELLKKLQPYLEDGKYKFFMMRDFANDRWISQSKDFIRMNDNDLNTLSLEQAIELLHKNEVGLRISTGTIDKDNNLIYSIETNIENNTFLGYNLLEELEKMLEYLIDNDLLGKNH